MTSPLDALKIEYNNLYKFITSIGIGLMGLSVAIPWFIMKIDLPMHSANTEAGVFDQESRDARSHQYSLIIHHYPKVCLALFIAGIAVMGYGLKKWRERQKQADASQDLNYQRDAKQFSTDQATSEEREKKIKDEVEEGESTEAGEGTKEGQEEDGSNESLSAIEASARDRHLKRRKEAEERLKGLEGRIGELIAESFVSTHDLQHGVRVNSKAGGVGEVIVDFVARSNNSKRWTSFSADVKMVNLQSSLFRSPNTIRGAVMNLAVGSRGIPRGPLPRGEVGRPAQSGANAIAIFVLDDTRKRVPSWEGTSRNSSISKVEKLAQSINSVLKDPVGVIVLKYSEVMNIAADDFRTLVVGALAEPDTVVF